LARSALLLISVAVVALVIVSHAATRLSNETLLSMDSQKELERLERDTFESPDSTYTKALAQLNHAKVTQVRKRTDQTVGGGFLEQCAFKDPLGQTSCCTLSMAGNTTLLWSALPWRCCVCPALPVFVQ